LIQEGDTIMLLTADIGNTSIALGAYKNDKLIFTTGMLTDKNKSADEYAEELKKLFELKGINKSDFSGSVVSSVVPEITDNFTKALEKLTGTKAISVGEEYNGNFKVTILPVSHIGADLIAVSVGAIKKYKLPCLVADLGTATKIVAIDKDGYFRGCTISPGVKISLDALAKKASLLPDISFAKPERVIGENTVECMQSGIVFGTAAMLDGLIKRMKAELGGGDVTVVATGGYSKGIIPCCETEIIYDENLLSYGLKVIYDRSRE